MVLLVRFVVISFDARLSAVVNVENLLSIIGFHMQFIGENSFMFILLSFAR